MQLRASDIVERILPQCRNESCSMHALRCIEEHFEESQRDSALKPKVARTRATLGPALKADINRNAVAQRGGHEQSCATALRLKMLSNRDPKVASPRLGNLGL